MQIHESQPFTMDVGGEQHQVSYVPGESNTYVFGGNSNWRGPVWLCGETIIIQWLISQSQGHSFTHLLILTHKHTHTQFSKLPPY